MNDPTMAQGGIERHGEVETGFRGVLLLQCCAQEDVARIIAFNRLITTALESLLHLVLRCELIHF